jgi:hypothetical protein
MEGAKFMKNRFYISLVAFLLLCLLGWAQYAKAQRSDSMKQTWEYQVIAANPNQLMSQMNKLGAEGWELVAVSGDGPVFAYLKRPK